MTRLTIVGATGGIGGHLVQQALSAGHDVVAAVRSPEKLEGRVPVVRVDLADLDPERLEASIEGSDAVLSALGPRERGEWGILEVGTRAIVEAMTRRGLRRLLVVSGAGVSVVPTPSRPDPPRREPGAGFVNRYINTPLARRLLGEHFVDVAMMEHVLSDLDWTAVRGPLLLDRPLSGDYRTAFERNVRNGFRIGRADVVHFMLAALDRPETYGLAIAVAY